MRYAWLISMMACMLFASLISEAEETKKKEQKIKTVVVEETKGSNLKHIDLGEASGRSDRPRYGVEGTDAMMSNRSYNQNTGMMDIVPSDRAGELE